MITTKHAPELTAPELIRKESEALEMSGDGAVYFATTSGHTIKVLGNSVSIKTREGWERAGERAVDTSGGFESPLLNFLATIPAISEGGRPVGITHVGPAEGSLRSEVAASAEIISLKEAQVPAAEKLEVLFSAMTSLWPQVRWEAVVALVGMKTEGLQAIPRLLTALDDPRGHVRATALTAIGELASSMILVEKAGISEINYSTEAVIAAVQGRLKDPDPAVRLEAGLALGMFNTPDVVPSLARALLDSDDEASRAAEVALGMRWQMDPVPVQQAFYLAVSAMDIETSTKIEERWRESLVRIAAEAPYRKPIRI